MARALLFALLFFSTMNLHAEDAPPPAPKATEAKRDIYDAKLAGKFLDTVGTAWTKDRSCITCHTNLPALMARPSSATENRPSNEIRLFLEKEVTLWDKGAKPKGDAYVVATAVGLAVDDANRGDGKLSLQAKSALDRMLTLQRKTGEWNWLKCDWPPMEHDDYYGATLAAVGLGLAPGDYAKTPQAQAGIAKLKDYFAKKPSPDLHHKTMLLWASRNLPELMTKDDQRKAVKSLLELQHSDGGWSLPSLGTYQRRDQTANDPKAASDGYGTGFVSFVLLTNGGEEGRLAAEKGGEWLRTNQRQSGRWFTRSLNNDKQHYISNAGSAFAFMALEFPKPITSPTANR